MAMAHDVGQQRFRLMKGTRSYGSDDYVTVRAYLNGRLVGYALCERPEEVNAAVKEFTDDYDR